MASVTFIMIVLAVAHHAKLASSFVAPRAAAAVSVMSRIHMISSDDSSPPSTQDDVHNISIEYCSGCQWMLRSTWMASEMLTTFANDSSLTSISLIPKGPPLSEGGIFRITARSSSSNNEQDLGSNSSTLLWDRKIQGRFPESKELKQLIRDLIDPSKDLGHSDKKDGDSSLKEDDCIECREQQGAEPDQKTTDDKEKLVLPDVFYDENNVSIEYSVGAVSSTENGLYRANFYANELLSCAYERNAWWKQYQQDELNTDAPVMLETVTLLPNRELSGVMKVKLNDEMIIYDHSTEANDEYIDASALRKMITNSITHGTINLSGGEFDVMDDDEAEEARKYFGVF